MAWNGSGTFSRIVTTVSPAVSGTTIDVAEQNNYTADVTAGINACLAKNGENAATGDLDLGSNKITSMTDGTLATDAVNVQQLQSSGNIYKADTGAADAYAIAPSPAITSYVAGQVFRFKAVAANTGACTIAVNGLAAKDIKTHAIDDPPANTILANGVYTVVYDGTQFQIQGEVDVGFEASSNTGSIATTWSQVAYATEARDPGSNYASSYYTCPTDGVYQFNAQTTIASLDVDKYLAIALYVDTGGGDTLWVTGDQITNQHDSAAELAIARVTKSGFLNAGDIVSVYADTDEGGAAAVLTNAAYNYFDGTRLNLG